MLAGRTVRHVIDEVYIRLSGYGYLKRSDRESLGFAVGDLGTFVRLVFGKFALNAFILLPQVSHRQVTHVRERAYT